MTKWQMKNLYQIGILTILTLWVMGCIAIVKTNTMGKREIYNLQERLDIWATTATYVDVDTGEIIDEFTVKGLWTRQPLWSEGQTYRYGEYTIISKTVEYEKINKNTGHKWIRYNCKREK